MNVGQMTSKHLIAAVLLIIVITLGTGIYFATKEKPEAGPLPTELTVATSASTVRYRLDPVTLTATLTSSGAPVKGKVIDWSVTPVISVGIPPSTTDSSGQAPIYFHTLPPPVSSGEFSNLPITLTFTASFAGDNQYRGSTGSTSIEVKLAQGLSFETISHETYGKYKNHEYLVIENSGEWEKVWLLARGSEAYSTPEVDFSSHAVIAVFMGGRGSGGYGISIERIINVENEIIVNVRETYPGRIATTLAATSPHHIIKIERAQKPIVFEVQQFLAHAHDENWDPYDGIIHELVGEHRVEPGSGPPEPINEIGPEQGLGVFVVENDIRLAMGIEKTEFDLGENVAITLTVKNMGENKVTLTFPSFMPNIAFDFVIYDVELNQIYVHRTGFLPTVTEKILDPGQSYTEVLEWAQERFDEMQKPTPVGPGTYWLKGRLREGWWGEAEGPINRSALETNLIKFVVTSKE